MGTTTRLRADRGLSSAAVPPRVTRPVVGAVAGHTIQFGRRLVVPQNNIVSRHVVGAAVTVVMFGVAAGSAEPALAASPAAPPGRVDGLHVASPSIAVTIGQSIDDTVTQWVTEVVTVGLGPTTATTYAICAG